MYIVIKILSYFLPLFIYYPFKKIKCFVFLHFFLIFVTMKQTNPQELTETIRLVHRLRPRVCIFNSLATSVSRRFALRLLVSLKDKTAPSIVQLEPNIRHKRLDFMISVLME